MFNNLKQYLISPNFCEIEFFQIFEEFDFFSKTCACKN